MNAPMNAQRRQLVLHEDDVGMCHGANSAFLELTGLGACSSGAVMVPCPWFPEMAEAAAWYDERVRGLGRRSVGPQLFDEHTGAVVVLVGDRDIRGIERVARAVLGRRC